MSKRFLFIPVILNRGLLVSSNGEIFADYLEDFSSWDKETAFTSFCEKYGIPVENVLSKWYFGGTHPLWKGFLFFLTEDTHVPSDIKVLVTSGDLYGIKDESSRKTRAMRTLLEEALNVLRGDTSNHISGSVPANIYEILGNECTSPIFLDVYNTLAPLVSREPIAKGSAHHFLEKNNRYIHDRVIDNPRGGGRITVYVRNISVPIVNIDSNLVKKYHDRNHLANNPYFSINSIEQNPWDDTQYRLYLNRESLPYDQGISILGMNGSIIGDAAEKYARQIIISSAITHRAEDMTFTIIDSSVKAFEGLDQLEAVKHYEPITNPSEFEKIVEDVESQIKYRGDILYKLALHTIEEYNQRRQKLRNIVSTMPLPYNIIVINNYHHFLKQGHYRILSDLIVDIIRKGQSLGIRVLLVLPDDKQLKEFNDLVYLDYELKIIDDQIHIKTEKDTYNIPLQFFLPEKLLESETIKYLSDTGEIQEINLLQNDECIDIINEK